jgi:hypothetical protein
VTKINFNAEDVLVPGFMLIMGNKQHPQSPECLMPCYFSNNIANIALKLLKCFEQNSPQILKD